jgi:outer membrane protein TolC
MYCTGYLDTLNLLEQSPSRFILSISIKVYRSLIINNTRISVTVLSIFKKGMLAGTLLLAGCIAWPTGQYKDVVAPSADHVWLNPSVSSPQQTSIMDNIDIPENLLKPGAIWQLSDVISVALQNNPDTRSAWYAARSAADDWLSQKGNYYPQINAYANMSHTASSGAVTQPGGSKSTSVVSFDPTVQLTWLIFDLGGRDAAVDEKYQALLAADFTHNAAIQDTVSQVIQTYFLYANAKAVKKAYEISLDDAAANLDAAKQRHENGIATIADVLQLKTALSQAQVNLDKADGQVQTIRGALATAMGLPANTTFEIEELTLNPPVDSITETVDAYIKQAQENRPDLAAQRSKVEAALAHIRTTHSSQYPSLSFSDTLGGGIDNRTSQWENQNTAMLKLSIPIFQGNSLRYEELKAQEDANKQKATLDKLEQTVIYEVWSSYFSLKTAAQQVKTNNDLIESAQQSHDVALGRYKEGVGGYLDLLAAQSALESARAQRVVAMADWYISLAQLTRDTGMLWRDTHEEKGAFFDLLPGTTIKDVDNE